jgi:hypothetical protein
LGIWTFGVEAGARACDLHRSPGLERTAPLRPRLPEIALQKTVLIAATAGFPHSCSPDLLQE